MSLNQFIKNHKTNTFIIYNKLQNYKIIKLIKFDIKQFGTNEMTIDS